MSFRWLCKAVISLLLVIKFGHQSQDVLLDTKIGQIVGEKFEVKGGLVGTRFLGIPYAIPPTGHRRFKAPEPVAPWSTVFDAKRFGPICLQPLETDVWDMEPSIAQPEDQLYQHLRRERIDLPEDIRERISKIEEYVEKLRSRKIQLSPPESDFIENFTIASNNSDSFVPNLNDFVENYINNSQSDSPFDGLESNTLFLKKKFLKEYEMSEDCLSLNIYTPFVNFERPASLPVAVFIHGGSFYTNGGRLYPGERLSAEGIVVVTLNYRLGPFGFLSTGDSHARGNWGLLDQQLALQWVNDHISSFGGDKKKILLVGNSAGGASVILHLLSPLSRGLFSRVAAMSGCALAPWSIQSNPTNTTKKLAKGLGCPMTSSEDIIKCLRMKSAHAINQEFTTNVIQDGLWLAFAPVVDGDFPGAFLPASPQILLKNGKFQRIPLLMMLTRDEVTIWFRTVPKTMQKKGIENWMDNIIKGIFNDLDPSTLKAVAHVIRGFYIYDHGFKPSHRAPESSTEEVPVKTIANLFSDVGLRVPCVEETKILSTWTPIYLAEFAYTSDDDVRIRNKHWIGSYHESDLQYVFGQPLLGITNSLRHEDDAKVSAIAMNIIKSFADLGIPQVLTSENVRWPPYTIQEETHLEISQTPKIKNGYYKKRQHFWVDFLPLLTKWPLQADSNAPSVHFQVSTVWLNFVIYWLICR